MDKVLIISHLFPNSNEHSKGIFVFNQVEALSKFKQINVISPIMWIPKIKSMKSSKEDNLKFYNSFTGTVKIRYPKCFPISTRIKSTKFLFIAGLFYLIRVYCCIYKNKIKFDVIHSHFAYPDGFSSIFLGKFFKKPVVITVHGSDVYSYTYKTHCLKPLVIYALKNATHVIAVSTSLKNKLLEFGIEENKISVIFNGYNPNLFKPMNKQEVRNYLELPLNKKIVLFVGNLVPVKGVTYLIEAMEIISTVRSDVILVVVGDGYQKSELEIMVQKQRLDAVIHFVGKQPYEKIPFWMNSCDLLVLPSISEGFGVVLIEAAACGKPVVATNIGGIPEASLEGFRRLVPPKDSNSLALSIFKILDSNFNSNEIIKENTKFSVSNTISQLLDVYNNL